MDDIKTNVYEAIPEEIEVVKSLYLEPQVLLSGVMKYLKDNNI